jgi:hypothetical protein
VLEIVFVLDRRQNAFFGERVEVMRDELGALGVRSTVSLDGFPEPVDGRVYALVPPHEWVALHGGEAPPPELLSRTLVICAEQPGSTFFDSNEPLARGAGAVFDISPASVAEWRWRGIAAERLTLGYTARWAAPSLDEPRDVDVAFLGCASERRNRLLASYAPLLARRRCRLLLSDNVRPQTPDTPGFLIGPDKRELLRRTRVLLNVHVSERPYFEHLRVVEAILSGAVVVTEPGTGSEPLAAGTDFLCGRPESLGQLAAELAENDDRRRPIQQEAFATLAAHPLSAAAERFASAAAEQARSAPRARRAPWRPPPRDLPSPASQYGTEDPEADPARRALKQLRLESIETRRRLARLEAALSGERRGAVEIVERTPAHAAARPEISVIVALFNHEAHIEQALDSVAASTTRGTEVIVVDDGSEDSSAGRAREWLRAHPSAAALLVRHRWNRGLPHARNTALDLARAPLTFVLDADNALYRHGLARLAGALGSDPEASFAYGIIEGFDGAGPTGLVSYAAWDPERLRVMNYVDAMALVRTQALRALGGYVTDPRLHGWEDYDLWCGMANRGWRGVSVPEIVGRYRVAQHSMLRSTTQISNVDAFSVLSERHPRLMAGAGWR